MKNKKILLGTMTSMIAIATPIAAVISCSQDKTNEIKSVEGLMSNLFQQILTQLGDKVSAFQPILKKLSVKHNGETAFENLGKKMQKSLLNTQNIHIIGEGDKKHTLNEIFKNLKTLFNYSAIINEWEKIGKQHNTTSEQMEKDLKNCKMPFDGPHDKSPFDGLKKGDDLIPTAKKMNKTIEEVIKMIKGFANFKTKAEFIKENSSIKYMELMTYVMNIDLKESILSILKTIFKSIPDVLSSAKVTMNELVVAILKLDGKDLSLNINILNQKIPLNKITINLDSSTKAAIKALKTSGLDAIDKLVSPLIANEIEKNWNPDVKTLKEIIIDGKSPIISKKYTTTPKITENTGGMDVIGKYMKVLGKPEIVKAISDIIELLIAMGDKNKITNTNSLINKDSNKDSITEIIDNISETFNINSKNKDIITKVFSILMSLANIYK